jgi:C2 domain
VGECTLQFRGLDIRNVEPGLTGLGRSDPFFEVSRKNADHAAGVVRWNTIYRSAYMIDHLNPLWDKFTVSLEELCYCDVAWPTRITVYDYNRNGKHVEIGGFETTVQELSQRVAIRGNADRERAFEISREDKNAGTTQGLIVVLEATIELKEESSPVPSSRAPQAVPLEPFYPPVVESTFEA